VLLPTAAEHDSSPQKIGSAQSFLKSSVIQCRTSTHL